MGKGRWGRASRMSIAYPFESTALISREKKPPPSHRKGPGGSRDVVCFEKSLALIATCESISRGTEMLWLWSLSWLERSERAVGLWAFIMRCSGFRALDSRASGMEASSLRVSLPGST